MRNLAKHYSNSNVLQTEQLRGELGKRQVKNSEDGYSFQITDTDKLDRFLILGTKGGTFYINESELTVKGLEVVEKLLLENPEYVIKRAVEISQAGRAAKNDYALMVLAMASVEKYNPNIAMRWFAYNKLSLVARTGTHLMQYLEYRKTFGGTLSSGLKKAIKRWILNLNVDGAAYQMMKYPSRSNWSFRDILRFAHIKPDSEEWNALFSYVSKGYKEELDSHYPKIVKAVHTAKTKEFSSKEKVSFIKETKLTHEMIPTEWKQDAKVYEALLYDMNLMALIRNLNNLDKNGLLQPFSDSEKFVIEKITNKDELVKSRIHPMFLINAYIAVKGDARGLTGNANKDRLVLALEDAFYASFGNVEPTGKNFMLGLDVSGSMSGPVSGGNFSCAVGSAVMAMVTARTEKNYIIKGFTSEFVDLDINHKTTFSEAFKKVQRSNFGRTDCSLPMIYALEKGIDIDVFSVYTDSETYAGEIHPVMAIEKYNKFRSKTFKKGPAKLIVVGMAANDFSIADPNNPNMLDVVGFDVNTPSMISGFSRM